VYTAVRPSSAACGCTTIVLESGAERRSSSASFRMRHASSISKPAGGLPPPRVPPRSGGASAATSCLDVAILVSLGRANGQIVRAWIIDIHRREPSAMWASVHWDQGAIGGTRHVATCTKSSSRMDRRIAAAMGLIVLSELIRRAAPPSTLPPARGCTHDREQKPIVQMPRTSSANWSRIARTVSHGDISLDRKGAAELSAP